MMAMGLVEPGEKVLSACVKGELHFADLMPDCSIQVATSTGGALPLASPCTLLRIIKRRHGVKITDTSNAHSSISYKGVALNMLRATSSSRRRP